MFKRSALVALIPMVMAAYSWAGIAGSKHDFSTADWNGTGEICKTCHTPHNAKPMSVSGRLWNHDLTNATYTMNAHDMDTETGSAATMLDQKSRLCLSCHDGTVALGAFGGNDSAMLSSGNINTYQGGAVNLGTDLSNDHPLGATGEYVYVDEKTVGTRFKAINMDATDPTKYAGTVGVSSSNGGTGTLSLVPMGTRSVITVVNGVDTPVTRTNYVVSCYTCHGAHGNGSQKVNGVSQTIPNMLRKLNTKSDLCLTCHNK